MSNQSWWSSKQFGPFAALLAAQVFFIALSPIGAEFGFGGTLVKYGFMGVLVAGLGVARESTRFMTIAIVLLAVNILMRLKGDLVSSDEGLRILLRSAFGAAYLGYLIIALIRTLTSQREATLDTVLGGINVYLLLALMFMELHRFVEQLLPGSYLRGGISLSEVPSGADGAMLPTLFYFSFTTLTTLGYGDIAPARPIAQFLCGAEAVIGQLFVAIFIGGLVALRVGSVQRDKPADA